MKLEKLCGTCAFGHHMQPVDMKHRHCYGMPPQILLIPQPKQTMQGGKVVTQMTMEFRNARPIVPATDKACSLYQARDFGGASYDDPSEERISGIELDAVGTG